MRKFKSLLPHYLRLLADGKCTLKIAAESTGYNPCYLSQLKKRYLVEGFACLDRKKTTWRHPKTLPESLKRKIVAIYSADEYKDINFRYFNKCLKDFEDIHISDSALRNIMDEYGIKSPEAHHIKKIDKHHRARLRRENEGDLIQIDGTPYAWFYKSGNNKKYDLQGGIDDATGKITGLYMTENECLYGYCEVLRMTNEKYGLPREIYSDRAAIFCVTPKEKQNLTVWEQLAGIHDKKTQWQRILDELSIKQILAWSPQAKGRVERMWLTVQGRLPLWLYKHGIKTVEDANKNMSKFIDEFNAEFSVAPANDFSFWRKATENLDDILCAQIPRKTDSSGRFSFHSYHFSIKDCPRVRCINFLLCISERGIYARVDGKYYDVQILDELQWNIRDTMPNVVYDIVYRYMYAYAKELSA